MHHPDTAAARRGATITGMTTFYQKMMWVSSEDYKCVKHYRKPRGRKNFIDLNKITRIILEEILMVSGALCGLDSIGVE